MPVSKLTPFFIHQQCGPRVASIFRHIGTYDTRDCRVFPTQGVYVKTTNELIGEKITQYGSLKSEGHIELNAPLFGGMSLQLSGRVGRIFENQRIANPTKIDSLFFLGGPLNLRGFEIGGATPSLEGVPKGSNIYWASAVHLWAPLPFSRYFGGFGELFRTHLFYNFGNCDSLSLGKWPATVKHLKISENTFSISDNMRIACGLGLAFRIGGRARIEFNYCYPLARQKTDRVNNSFSFAIGYEYL